MKKEKAKLYIITSIIALFFSGFGLGLLIASDSVFQALFGFSLWFSTFLFYWILIKKVEKAGYRVEIVEEDKKNF